MSAEELIKVLTEKNKKIATMESCTGGGFANTITNTPGSSDVFNFGAVTYSNDYKIKFGVPKEVIDEFTVYSIETARAMAKAIVDFTNADFGVGITGKLKRVDKCNLCNADDLVYISVYSKELNKNYDESMQVTKDTREENKRDVIEKALALCMKAIQGEDYGV